MGNIDRWIEDGSFFKIRQVTLGYSLNFEQFKKYINNLRIAFTAQNPFTFTKYTGLDPEFNNGYILEFGVDGNSYPTPRIYLFSVTASF